MFALIVITIWTATQWTAFKLEYQPALGRSWFNIGELPVYVPWRLFQWWYAYEAYAPDVSRTLSVFVGLIVTNCIVLGRAEAFAVKNNPLMAALDGIGNGLGYSLVLIVVATIRELLGAGTLLGIDVLPLAQNGGWYVPNGLLLMPPSAFFLIGFLIWVIRSWQPEQVEEPEFREVEQRAGETS